MEIILIIAIIYVGYRFLKGETVSKTLIATEIQNTLREINKTGIITYHGDIISDIQGYVENTWEHAQKVQDTLKNEKNSPHKLCLATYISAFITKRLHDLDQPNSEIFLMCTTNLAQRAHIVILSGKHQPNIVDDFLMGFSINIIENIMQKDTTPLDEEINTLLSNT